MQMFKNFLTNESGATAIEYGLIAGLISVVIIVAVTAVGGGLQEVFQSIQASLESVPTGPET
jgi:pilus assembly protein Flp/PilA